MTKSCGKNVLSAKQVKKNLEHLHDTHLVKLGAVSDQLFSVQSLKASLSRLFEAGELGEVITDPDYFNDGICLDRDTIEFKNLCGFMVSDCFFDLDDGFFHIGCKVRFLNSFNVRTEDEIEFIPRVSFDGQGRPKIVAFDVKIHPFIDGITEAVKSHSYGYTHVKNFLSQTDSNTHTLILGYFDKNKIAPIELERVLSRLSLSGAPIGEGSRPPTGRSKKRWRTVDHNNSLGRVISYAINDHSEDAYFVAGVIELNFNNPLVLEAFKQGALTIAPRVSMNVDIFSSCTELICFDLIQE